MSPKDEISYERNEVNKEPVGVQRKPEAKCFIECFYSPYLKVKKEKALYMIINF